MANVVVRRTPVGDEEKRQIVDCSAERPMFIARFRVAHNAGHTLVSTARSTSCNARCPSGVVRGGKLSVIGNGCA